MQNLFKVLIPLVFSLSIGAIGQARAAWTAQKLFQFPDDPATAIENVAIRPNGHLILSIDTMPSVYTLDPSSSTPNASLLHTFTNATSCMGITKIGYDQYAVVVGNFSTTTFTGTLGTFSIWRIDMTKYPAAFSKIADLPSAKDVDGLTSILSNPPIILAADAENGIIYSINGATGAVAPVIQGPAFTGTAAEPLGVDGIRVSGNLLHYTNPAQGTYGIVPIDMNGLPTGAPEVLANNPPGDFYDDLAVDSAGNAFITSFPSAVSEATLAGEQTVIVNSTAIVHPTAAIFSLDEKKLYVVTSGLVPGDRDGNANSPSGQVFVLTPS